MNRLVSRIKKMSVRFSAVAMVFIMPLFVAFVEIAPLTYQLTYVRFNPDNIVEYEEIDRREEGLEMEGRIPFISQDSGVSASVQTQINSEIDRIFALKVSNAREQRSRVLMFDFETYFSRPYMSIILKSTATSASSKTEVASINFNVSSGELIRAEDIVGTHVIELADRLLVERIRRNPERYNPSFAGMRNDQAFSVTDTEIIFWFNEFQLAPGFEGVVPLSLRLDNILEVSLSRDDYHIRREFNVKMVPLNIIGQLGYNFNWHHGIYPEPHRVTVYHDDDLVIELTMGVNNYVRESRFTRSLEAAPEFTNGTTYVPISFFDQILSLVSYSIDERDNITFASYPVTDSWFER